MPRDPMRSMQAAADQELDARPADAPAPRHLWEQRDGESDGQFLAFRTFRDLPAGRRSLEATAKRLKLDLELTRRVSKKFKWDERVRAWDAMKERVRTSAIKASITRITQMEAVALENATELYTRNWIRLNKLSKENRKFVLMPSELAMVTDLMIKLARLTRGEATDRSEVELTDARARLDEIIGRYERSAEAESR